MQQYRPPWVPFCKTIYFVTNCFKDCLVQANLANTVFYKCAGQRWIRLLLIAEKLLNFNRLRYQTPKNNLGIYFVSGTTAASRLSHRKKNTILDDHSTSVKAKCVEGPKGGFQGRTCLFFLKKKNFFLKRALLKAENREYYTGCQNMSVLWVQRRPKAMLLNFPSAKLWVKRRQTLTPFCMPL